MAKSNAQFQIHKIVLSQKSETRAELRRALEQHQNGKANLQFLPGKLGGWLGFLDFAQSGVRRGGSGLENYGGAWARQ